MGTSVKGESKKRKARRALSWLKSAAIVIAVLDLILAINDSRNVGRFFLLLSMSSTFSIIPENLLRDHCRENITGICQTYTQFATGKRFSARETLLTRRAYLTKQELYSPSKPFPSDCLSELMLSWKSMFDQSRAAANVSFYYDDSNTNREGSTGGMRESDAQQKHPSSSRPISLSSTKKSSLISQKAASPNSRGIRNEHNNLKESNTDFSTTYVHVESHGESGSSRSISTTPATSRSIATRKETAKHRGDDIGPSKSIGDMAGIHSYSISSDHTFLRTGRARRRRDVLVENAETGRMSVVGGSSSSSSSTSSSKAPFLISEQGLNANGVGEEKRDASAAAFGSTMGESKLSTSSEPFSSSSSTSPSPSSTKSPMFPPSTLPTHPSTSTTTKIDKETTKETTLHQHPDGFHASSTVFISDDLTTRGLPLFPSSPSSFPSVKVTHEEEAGDRVKVPLKAGLMTRENVLTPPTSIVQQQVQPVSSIQKSNGFLDKESSKRSRNNKEESSVSTLSLKLNLTEGKKINSRSTNIVSEDAPKKIQSTSSKNQINILEFGRLISKGPKELLGYVEEEMFSRWPVLLETVQMVLKQKNMTSSQLVSPEATRIKMHIEVRPFGPDPFKDARKRLKATQQTLFDYPWLTIVQLYGRLSESFVLVFIGISVYTWVWGTAIALLLLIGSYREDQTTLHIWMVFNIIYTFLQFMIDNWIHTNIKPERSSVCLWLFNIYSVYKPLAAYIAITQLSEIEKVRFDSEEDYLSSSSSSSMKKLIPSSSSVHQNCGDNHSRKNSLKKSVSSYSSFSSVDSPTASTRTEDNCCFNGIGRGSSSCTDYRGCASNSDLQNQPTLTAAALSSSSPPMVSCMTKTTTTTTAAATPTGGSAVASCIGETTLVRTNSLTTLQLQEATLRLRESTIVDMANQSTTNTTSSTLALPLSAVLRASLENGFLQNLVAWNPATTTTTTCDERGKGVLMTENGVENNNDGLNCDGHHNNHLCSKATASDLNKCGSEVDEEYEEDLDEEDEEEDSLDDEDDEDDDSDDEETKDQEYEDNNDETCAGDNGVGRSHPHPLPKTLSGCLLYHP